MSIKLFVTRCLMSLAPVLVVASLASAAEPTAPGNQPHDAARTEEPGGQVDPHASKILRRACTVLADSDAFTFHAEINFDQVMPSEVKLQFAGASDFAVRRPNALAVDYESDLGAKHLWYNGKTLTIFDAPTGTYASTPVPPSIDGMLDSVAEIFRATCPALPTPVVSTLAGQSSISFTARSNPASIAPTSERTAAASVSITCFAKV